MKNDLRILFVSGYNNRPYPVLLRNKAFDENRKYPYYFESKVSFVLVLRDKYKNNFNKYY
jgi:hypothetical protein